MEVASRRLGWAFLCPELEDWELGEAGGVVVIFAWGVGKRVSEAWRASGAWWGADASQKLGIEVG